MRNEFIMGNIKNVLFQDELWCRILEVYTVYHTQTPGIFLKNLGRNHTQCQK